MDTTKKKIIEFRFRPDGTSSIETSGFTGTECQQASAPYEEALGVVVSDVPTAESRHVKPIDVKAKIKTTLG